MNDTAKKSHLSGMHILAVDDEEDILDTIEDLLEEVQLDRAMEYESACEMLRDNEYDLAILDIMGVNGMGLLEEATNRGVPAVMLTAHAMNPETLHSSMEKGALSYLPKEELPRLEELLESLLDTERKGQSTWKLLFTVLGGFFDKKFGEDWCAEYPEIARHYGGPGRWHNQG